MRYVIGVLLLCLLSAGTVQAQPSQQVIIEETLRIYPGGAWSKCLDVPRSTLTVQASAAGLRTPETAHLLFRPNRQTVRPDSYLAVPLDLEEIVSAHTVEAGVYCYDVSVTSNHPDMDPSRPERPFKSAHIRVTLTELP